MALFPFMDYLFRPGPGVFPDAPRKKGAKRWFEIAGRDFGKLWFGGFMALLGMVPYLLGLYFSIASHLLLALFVSCAVGGMLAGIFWSALMDTILRSLRDEPMMWRYNWIAAIKRDWRQCLLPGALCGEVFGVQFFMLYHLQPGGAGLPLLVLLLAGLILMTCFAVWMWPQIPLFTLPLPMLVKNTLLLALGHVLPTLGATLVWLVYLAAALFLSPISMLVLPITSIWLPFSIGLLMIYRPLEGAFDLEASIAALHEREHMEE